MTQLPINFDVSKGRRNRNSKKAYDRVRPVTVSMRERILTWIRACGFEGATVSEISLAFNKPLHTLSGRITELRFQGMIFDSLRDRRGNCTVWVSDKKWINGSAQ